MYYFNFNRYLLTIGKNFVYKVFVILNSWPCLNQWLETKPNHQTCPVCKAGISCDKVIPLYGRGSANSTDPRTKTPPRPQAQRPEPETRVCFC